MAKDMENLRALRDHLVADRRAMVEAILAEPSSSGDLSGDFVGLQRFIDSIEQALMHEEHTSRQGQPGGGQPGGGPPPRGQRFP